MEEHPFAYQRQIARGCGSGRLQQLNLRERFEGFFLMAFNEVSKKFIR
jgi:hypothetical protein